MARTVWSDLGTRPGSAFLIVAEIAADFGGGPTADDPFDTARLRFAANLMVRTCTQSKLGGDFAVQPPARQRRAAHSLRGNRTPPTSRGFCEIVGGRDHEAAPWRGLRRFLLDEARHESLLAVAGPPDSRGAGRRVRAAREREAADRQQWGRI